MTTMSHPELDPAAVESFAQSLLQTYNGGALAIAISIGHRTALFDTMADLPPSTSGAIASAAGLSERYVREWLGAMVTGRIVHYDADSATYTLPAAHAAVLTRRASPFNMAVSAQWIPLMAGVEERIVESFHKGGGAHYHEYPRFHAVMAEESEQTVVAPLVDTVLPLVPGLSERLSRGIDVVDVGCGRGLALMRLAEVFPASRFHGYELSEQALLAAGQEAARRGLANVSFEMVNLACWTEVERFDLITAFDIVHDQAQPDVVLRNIRRALRPDGVFLMQDIAMRSQLEDNLSHPLAPFLYTISLTHCMSVSLAQDGAGLGTCWGRELAQQMLAEAGFGAVTLHHLSQDIMNDWYVVRP